MFLSIYFIAAISTAILMESITWLTHRYVMHGILWYFHKDHHQPESGFFEKNDWFFVIFALPSIALFYLGSRQLNPYALGVGTGIFIYGVAYFLVHDVIIHQRFRWWTRSSSRYVRAIRWAHKMHHKHLGPDSGESFGMLYVAKKYWHKVRKDDLIAAQNREKIDNNNKSKQRDN